MIVEITPPDFNKLFQGLFIQVHLLLYLCHDNRHIQFSSAPGNEFIVAVRNSGAIPSGTVGFNHAQVSS